LARGIARHARNRAEVDPKQVARLIGGPAAVIDFLASRRGLENWVEFGGRSDRGSGGFRSGPVDSD
jgi:hypothetical protein